MNRRDTGDRIWLVLLGMFIVHAVAAVVLKSWGFGLPAIMLGVWLAVFAFHHKVIELCP